jgi:hypothetical protein
MLPPLSEYWPPLPLPRLPSSSGSSNELSPLPRPLLKGDGCSSTCAHRGAVI